MDKIVIHKSAQECLKFNEQLFDKSYFQHYHLIQRLEFIAKKKLDLVFACNISSPQKTQSILFVDDDVLYLYSNSFSNVLVQKASEIIEKLSIQAFYGNKLAIHKLIDHQEIRTELINIRNVYESSSVSTFKHNEQLQLRLCAFPQEEEIFKLFKAYFLEDFEGGVFQSDDDLKRSIFLGLGSKRIFGLFRGSEIVSIMRHINKSKGHPMLGALFTPLHERGKGYGTYLVQHLTQHLLLEGATSCGLLTETTNMASNKVFQNAGYRKVYDWSFFQII